MTPFVSIIIPVYNRPVLVAEAIESVLAQTNPNWELIVVDDGSTDHTWGVLEGYAAKDERIRVFKRDREPKGAPTCRNIGAGMAKGVYLIFLDSDDLLTPWSLEERLFFMESNPDVDAGLFQALELHEGKPDANIRGDKGITDFLWGFVTNQVPWSTINVIWRKDAFFLLEGWNESALAWQDPDLHIRALLKNTKFKWSETNPDCIYQNIESIERIWLGGDKFIKLHNRIEISGNLLRGLPFNYKKDFTRNLKATVLKSSFPFGLQKIRKIGKIAFDTKIFSEKERIQYILLFSFYGIVKKLPYLRRPIYKRILKKINSLEQPRKAVFPEGSVLKVFKENYSESQKTVFRRIIKQI